MGEHKLGREFDKADQAPFQAQFAKKFVDDNGIKLTLQTIDQKQLAELLKSGKKAQIIATLDLPLFRLWVQVGSKRILFGSKDLDSLRDNDKQRDILNKLVDSKLITDAEIYKWQDTHLGKDQLTFLHDEIMDMQEEQKKKQDRYDYLKNFTFAKSNHDTRGELRDFCKKHSWDHYIAFVEDIDNHVDGQKIVETYVANGAKLPVNLPDAMKNALAHQLASHAKPDFTAARAIIVKVIDVKFIPAWRKDEMAELEPRLKHLKSAIPDMTKAYVRGGGKPGDLK